MSTATVEEPRAPHTHQSGQRMRKWQLMAGSHVEATGPKPTQQRVYRRGEVVESPLDLATLYNPKDPNMAPKFREVFDTEYPLPPTMSPEQLAAWKADLEAKWRDEFERRLRNEKFAEGPGAPASLPPETPTVRGANDVPTTPAKAHRTK